MRSRYFFLLKKIVFFSKFFEDEQIIGQEEDKSIWKPELMC
jgi:hypothetical protein